MSTWQSYLEFLEESMSGDSASFSFDYIQSILQTIYQSWYSEALFFKNQGKLWISPAGSMLLEFFPQKGESEGGGVPNNLL